jgi:hypothetical protein
MTRRGCVGARRRRPIGEWAALRISLDADGNVTFDDGVRLVYAAAPGNRWQIGYTRWRPPIRHSGVTTLGRFTPVSSILPTYSPR